MIMNHFKHIQVYLLVGLLASCSYNDLTDLWPSGNDVEEEIVIREIPEESFDPEDTEEITITEIDASDEVADKAEVEVEVDMDVFLFKAQDGQKAPM